MGQFKQRGVPDVQGISECRDCYHVVELLCFAGGEASCHFCHSVELLCPVGSCGYYLSDVWSPHKLGIKDYSEVLVVSYCCDGVC